MDSSRCDSLSQPVPDCPLASSRFCVVTIGTSQDRQRGIGWYCCGLILSVLVALNGGCQKTQEKLDSTAPSTTEARVQRIPYAVLREWGIPNGGFGKLIVIDPQYRNEKDLKTLGETLRNDTRQDRHAFVLIFDDSLAAAMYQNVANLSEKDGVFYDRHSVGSYNRNINTGFHSLEVSRSAGNGAAFRVDY